MTVGREPAGYRLARELRRRGWTITWAAVSMDYGHAYGVAARVWKPGCAIPVAAFGARRRFARPNPGNLTLKLELRAHVARALLERLPC